MLMISFAPRCWAVHAQRKKLRHYVTAAMRLTAIIKSSPHITGTFLLPLPNQSASQAQTPHHPARPQSQSNHIIMSNRALPVIGLAAAGGVGYYLYNAGGDPKLAEKKMERTSLMQRAWCTRANSRR
jgi:hypothetical protein